MGPDFIDEQQPVAAYLSFDEAKYLNGRVPCQMLAATFHATSISYCVKTARGTLVPVPKSFLRAMMEKGKYVFVTSRKPERVVGIPTPCFCVDIVDEAKDYSGVPHQLMLSQRQMDHLMEDVHDFPKLKGRKRAYYPNGRVGPSSNILTKVKRDHVGDLLDGGNDA